MIAFAARSLARQSAGISWPSADGTRMTRSGTCWVSSIPDHIRSRRCVQTRAVESIRETCHPCEPMTRVLAVAEQASCVPAESRFVASHSTSRSIAWGCCANCGQPVATKARHLTHQPAPLRGGVGVDTVVEDRVSSFSAIGESTRQPQQRAARRRHHHSHGLSQNSAEEDGHENHAAGERDGRDEMQPARPAGHGQRRGREKKSEPHENVATADRRLEASPEANGDAQRQPKQHEDGERYEPIEERRYEAEGEIRASREPRVARRSGTRRLAGRYGSGSGVA